MEFLSVGNPRPNDFENGLLGLLDGKAGGIDVDSIGRLHERRFGARTSAVTFIALTDLRGQSLSRNGFALLMPVVETAPHALGGSHPEKS